MMRRILLPMVSWMVGECDNSVSWKLSLGLISLFGEDTSRSSVMPPRDDRQSLHSFVMSNSSTLSKLLRLEFPQSSDEFHDESRRGKEDIRGTEIGSDILSCCSPASSTASTSQFSFSSSFSRDFRIQGWMYWQQPLEKSSMEAWTVGSERKSQQQRFTKVFAVLRNQFLLLYPRSTKTTRRTETPLVQIAVAEYARTGKGVFQVHDPHGEEMILYLYDQTDDSVIEAWEDALDQAAEQTHAHFVALEMKVDDLPRNSLYRGSLHAFRMRRPSVREHLRHQFKRLSYFGPALRRSTRNQSCNEPRPTECWLQSFPYLFAW